MHSNHIYIYVYSMREGCTWLHMSVLSIRPVIGMVYSHTGIFRSVVSVRYAHASRFAGKRHQYTGKHSNLAVTFAHVWNETRRALTMDLKIPLHATESGVACSVRS